MEIDGIRVYPVKGLQGVRVDEARVLEGGTLEGDREFAFFDSSGEVVNGKRTPRVHHLGVRLEDDAPVVTFPHGEEVNVVDQSEQAEDLLSSYFDVDGELRRDGSLGYVDRRNAGPSVVSTATLREFASWFDGVDSESARRRLRANVEVSGVPAFWEDGFVDDREPGFEAGGVRFEGVEPCGRCVVPSRDPDTGDVIDGFREKFVGKRREAFPDDIDEDAYDHLYTMMLITRVPDPYRGERVSVGDDVVVS